jgi:hypothetical protein
MTASNLKLHRLLIKNFKVVLEIMLKISLLGIWKISRRILRKLLIAVTLEKKIAPLKKNFQFCIIRGFTNMFKSHGETSTGTLLPLK